MNQHQPQSEPYTTADGRRIGGVMMDLRNITLRFGGVTAIKDISFDIREGEIRAIIGPNGAGKSSMLNVISGFYVPQEGEVWFRGKRRPALRPYQVARQGIARTFQNIALFDGMTVLDNIMTGRLTMMKSGLVAQALGLFAGAGLQILLEGLQVGLDVFSSLGGGHGARSVESLAVE